MYLICTDLNGTTLLHYYVNSNEPIDGKLNGTTLLYCLYNLRLSMTNKYKVWIPVPDGM